jgi:hypothetical protein
MIAFRIPAGTQARAVRADHDWMPGNIRRITTCDEHLFLLEDVIVDPRGKVGTGPQHNRTIGGAYAARGWYGFHDHDGHGHADTQIARTVCRQGWVLLVPAGSIDTGDGV